MHVAPESRSISPRRGLVCELSAAGSLRFTFLESAGPYHNGCLLTGTGNECTIEIDAHKTMPDAYIMLKKTGPDKREILKIDLKIDGEIGHDLSYACSFYPYERILDKAIEILNKEITRHVISTLFMGDVKSSIEMIVELVALKVQICAQDSLLRS